jgi:hypothetical protein
MRLYCKIPNILQKYSKNKTLQLLLKLGKFCHHTPKKLYEYGFNGFCDIFLEGYLDRWADVRPRGVKIFFRGCTKKLFKGKFEYVNTYI